MSATRHTADTPGDVPHVAGPGRLPPPARAPRALAEGTWDDDVEPRTTVARRWLLVASVVPWVVVAGLFLTRPAPAAPPPSPATPTAAATPTASAPPAEATATSSPLVEPSRLGAPAAAAVDSPTATRATASARAEAVAVAATVARLWLSTQPSARTIEGLGTDPGADGRYVEHVVVEHVDHPAGDVAVLTVLAIALPVEDDGYGVPELIRVAVPVRFGLDTAPIAGTPWRLPAPALRVDPVEGHATPGPEVLDLAPDAALALTAAGYADVDVRGLTTTDSWPLVATVTAVAPGTTTATDHTVLLRHDVGGLVVAGHVTAPAPTTRTDEP